jgi:hypothetical protein
MYMKNADPRRNYGVSAQMRLPAVEIEELSC